MRRTPICWGIPMDEVLYSKFFTIFLRNSNIMPFDGSVTTESTYLPKARNYIHNQFLEESNLPFLMMVDSDVMFPPNAVERLLAHRVPVVGGWYKNKMPKVAPHPIVYDFVSETDEAINFKHREVPGEGLEKVDGIGLGFVLMSRYVAEQLGKDPYSMEHAGEDLVLCRKLMKLGISLFVDWSVGCAHIGVSFV